MKKLTILVSLLLIFSSTFAQMGKVRNAYANYQNGNVLKAKELIDEATVHPKSMNDATTWLYRGNIYVGVYDANSELLTLDAQALAKAAEAFARAKELDTENKFEKEINEGFISLAAANYNEAVKGYNAKTYDIAGDLFAEAYEYAKKGNIIDTNSIYNCAIAYNLAKLPAKAERYYELLINLDYNKPAVYSEYSNILNELGQLEKATATIAKGRELFPEDYAVLISEANIFLKTNQTEKALFNLETALAFENSNYSIYHSIGAMYNMIFIDTLKTEEERFSAYEKSVEAYKKVISLEPTYFDAVYNLGAIIFNKGVYFLERADALPFGDKNYDNWKKTGDEFLVEALPFLEQALVLNPEDNSTLYSLKQIYSRTGEMDKYKVVNDKLQDLDGQKEE